MKAAGGEAAARLGIDGRAHFAFEDDPLLAGVELGDGYGREKGAAVGMDGLGEEFLGGAALDDLAHVHDDDIVGDVLHDGEVVGDEEVGEAELVLEVHEEVEDLGLDGHVEGRDGLVADDELGVEGEGAGYADALASSSVEFVGVGVVKAVREADSGHELAHPVLVFLVGIHFAVDLQGLADDGGHGVAGIDGGVGVLEDHLHAGAEGFQLPGGGCRHLGAVVDDGAGGGFVEADEEAARRGLAAARLADHAEGFSLFYIEGDVVDGVETSACRLEILAEVADAEYGRGGIERRGAGGADRGGLRRRRFIGAHFVLPSSPSA